MGVFTCSRLYVCVHIDGESELVSSKTSELCKQETQQSARDSERRDNTNTNNESNYRRCQQLLAPSEWPMTASAPLISAATDAIT